jgi:hypothetical protein
MSNYIMAWQIKCNGAVLHPMLRTPSVALEVPSSFYQRLCYRFSASHWLALTPGF